MDDYISREEAIAIYDDDEYATPEYHVPIPVIIQNLKDLPSVDAVKVIRCKDCRYYSNGECESVEMWQNLCGETTEVEYISRYPNDFCSYAARRTDE